VLQGPAAAGGTLGAQVGAIDDPVAKAIVEQGEPEELAARMARADGEGSLKAGELEKALRQLKNLARSAAIRQIQHDQSLAPQAEHVIAATVADYYQRFQRRFDAVDTKRPLDKALSLGDDEDEERNRDLVQYAGSIPPWRELDLALRQHPRDMDRVRTVLNGRDQTDIAAIAAQYHEQTIGKRSLETDLLGTPEQQMIARYKDKDKANAEIMEGRVLLGGGVFRSDSTDEATRLDEERRWTFGRFYALERAVIQNRGTFAELRDWVGNIEKGLVDRADQDATDASSAIANALLAVPPDLATARAALAELRRATRRLEHNLDIYKEATKAAFNEFVDFAVLAVTTIVTLGEGSAIILAIRATAATIGTKLVLKGDDYSVDEFLMDLRSGVGAAVGGKIAEGVLRPIAGRVAAYATESGLSRTFAGKVLAQVGKAAEWEASNATNTAAVNLATGQELTTGLGASGQAKNLALHGITTAVKAGRGGPQTAGAQSEEGEAGNEAARPIAEGAARTTSEETVSPRTEEVPGSAGPSRSSARQGPVDASDPWAGGPAVDEATTGVEAEVPESVPHTSMALPEPTKAGTTSAAEGHVVRARNIGPTRDLTADAARARARRPTGHADDTQVEVSPFESEQSRRAREEQEALAREHPNDAATIRESTAPDARTRTLAGEFAGLYEVWGDLHPVQRLEHIERIVNARLAEAGVPRVYVEEGPMGPGNAEFNMRTWKIRISRDSVHQRTPSLEQFAELSDSAAHEARHALHMFRGYRAALKLEEFVSSSGIAPVAEVAAREANAGTLPAEHMDLTSPAFGEALDVYRGFYGPGRNKRNVQAGRARSKNDGHIQQLEAEVAGLPKGSRARERAERELATARERRARLMNDYTASAHETDAWRTGSSTRAAVIERVTRDRIASLEEVRARALADQRRFRASLDEVVAAGGDATRVRSELADAQQRVRESRRAISRLEARLQQMAERRRGREEPDR